MSSNNKSKSGYLIKNALLFAIGNFGTKVLNFLLVPLYTNALSTTDYGIADVLVVAWSLLTYVFTLDIADAVFRFGISKSKDKENVLSYAIQLTFKGCMVLAAIVFISSKLNIIAWPSYCYVFLILGFISNSLYSISNYYLRATDHIQACVWQGIIAIASKLGLNLFFLLVLHAGLVGYLIALVVSEFIAIIYAMLVIRLKIVEYFRCSLSKQEKKKMLQYSVPLMFNAISWWVSNCTDKFFIIYFCGIAESGIYSIAYKIPTILSLITSIFSQAWNLSAIKEFDNDGIFFQTVYKKYSATLMISCSTLILFNTYIAKILFAKDFYAARLYSPILLLSSMFIAMCVIPQSVFIASKDTKKLAQTTMMAAGINIVLNTILISSFGTVGAAIATAISFFCIVEMQTYYAQKIKKWKVNRLKEHLLYLTLIIQAVLECIGKGNIFYQLPCFIIVLCLNLKVICEIVQVIYEKFSVFRKNILSGK